MSGNAGLLRLVPLVAGAGLLRFEPLLLIASALGGPPALAAIWFSLVRGLLTQPPRLED